MHLSQITLTNFRNFVKSNFKLDDRLTYVFGKNSQGKTNLLEGINVLFKGVGFRDSREEELIRLGTNETSIEGSLTIGESVETFKVDLIKKNGQLEKYFFLNKTKKNRSTYLKEVMSAVLFSPEQIEIIIGPPGNRREYFDRFLSATDLIYREKLNNYNQALRKRNKILEAVRDFNKLLDELDFWNDYLEENGRYVTEKRREYSMFLNSNKKIDSKVFSVIYKENVFDRKKIKNSLDREIKIKKTLIGPQRDDFEFYLENLDVNLYGSRSEERLALFWLKLNELRYWEKLTKKKPILLLDDIFSELDADNQKLVLSLIGNYQTVATSTDKTLIKLIKLSDNSAHHSINL